MKTLLKTRDLRVILHPEKGRCVLARRSYLPGDLIEVCPVLAYTEGEIFPGHFLEEFHYFWGPGKFAIALGFGSLYNHSSIHNNANFTIKPEAKVIEFRAIKPIGPGEEIITNYGYDLPQEVPPVSFTATLLNFTRASLYTY